MDEWNTLCVAMDTLGDTCLALQDYERRGIGVEEGEKYLRLYGMLQAVVIQQDAIGHLWKIVHGDALPPSPNSGWGRIRELRVLAVGHPVESRQQRRTFISRPTLSHKGFDRITWLGRDNRDEIEQVDIKGLYESYKTEAAGILRRIHDAQVVRWGEAR
jgi:hypothetical protein